MGNKRITDPFVAFMDAELGGLLSTGSVKRKASRRSLDSGGSSGFLSWGGAGAVWRSAKSAVPTGGAKKIPEVMVKIAGFGSGAKNAKNQFDYISRDGEIEIENERGEVLTGKEAVRAVVSDWSVDMVDLKYKKKQRDTLHLVLSMPAGTSPSAVRNAVRDFSTEVFGKNHEFVFALHTKETDPDPEPSPNPHCHVLVKMRGFDGRNLNIKKGATQEWRVIFAEKLKAHGVESSATPRQLRGVIKTPDSQVVRHIEKADSKGKRRESAVRKKARDSVAEEFTKSSGWYGKEIKDKIQQAQVKRAWLEGAALLESDATAKTVNDKEIVNAKPRYQAIGDGRFQQRWNRSALHQSRAFSSRREAFAGSDTSLRDVSSEHVVHDQGNPEVLLHADARDRVGWQDDRSDSVVRRTRVSVISDKQTGAADGLNRLQRTRAENLEMAEGIRRFVAAMPDETTRRDEVRESLLAERAKDSARAGRELMAEAFLKLPPVDAVKRHPDLLGAVGFVAAADAELVRKGVSDANRREVMDAVKQRVALAIVNGVAPDAAAVKVRSEIQAQVDRSAPDAG